MKVLSKKAFDRSLENIISYGRNLERVLAENYFTVKNATNVAKELKTFQNPDGGFGHGLESDFQMPLSSPLATSVAFRIIQETNIQEICTEMIQKGIRYFESTYDSERKGWYAVPDKVNLYPHASWWDYNTNTHMTMIDENWGNPTAEIIAYLYKYREYTTILPVDELLEYAIFRLHEKKEFTSQYEIYCYIRLYDIVPNQLKEKMQSKLTCAVGQVLCDDVNEWDGFVPYPVRLIKSPESETFQISPDLLDKNLNYLIESLELNGKITPKWHWADCKDIPSVLNWDMEKNCLGWERAKNEWTWVLTLYTLNVLGAYNRIESYELRQKADK